MSRAYIFGVLMVMGLVGGVAVAQDAKEDSAPEAKAATSTGEATEEDADAEEKPLDNRLKWSTASEIDNFGYHVYRGDTEEGPFERLTEDPMPGAGTTDEPTYYEFIDDTIDPTQDYYYYVESLAMDGTRERFTPVIRAKAKLPAAEDANSSEDAETNDTEGVTTDGSESMDSETDPLSQS